MLQDTDLFDKLPELSNVGGDVHATVEWTESVSPDERYEVLVSWRFRGELVGAAKYVIEPVFGTEAFKLYWVHLEFKEEWQDKGLYSTLVKNYRLLPTYGINTIVASPSNKEAERRLASAGFGWVGPEFVLDLTEPA